MTQKQWIATLPDGTEALISFWGGMDADPEVALKEHRPWYRTVWSPPLPIREVTQ